MKVNDFKSIYEQAKKTNIVKDDFFNCAGWMWINLTDKQREQLFNLMVLQGAKVEIHKEREIIYLENGMGIYK